MGKGQPGRQLLSTNLDRENEDDDNNKRKMIHREIEKQRRKEMATLHAGLRSLIPLEHIKGKRSMSDQMNGAVDYIKSLQTRIAGLGATRDDLRKSNSSRATESTSRSSSNCATSSCVEVHACSAGFEIVLSTTSSCSSGGPSGPPLSRVLQLLVGEGLTILSCVTTKVSDQRLMHNIQAQANDATHVDLAQLQETLDETILTWNNSPSS